MVQRQVPKPAEVFELMQFKKPELNGRKRRLDAALTIADLRAIAKRRTPKARVRLHRRRGRGRAVAGPRPPGVRGHRVPPVDPAPRARRRHGREVLGGPSALPFGIAPTGFTRLMQTEGETRRRRRGGGRRHPVHPVDARHDLDRGRQGGEPARAQLVPALRDARPRDLVRAGAPRRRGRVRHAVVHRRHPGRRRAAARQAQRLLDPAAADPRHDHQRDPAAVVVVRLPHDPEARVRVALVDRRHRRRAARRRDGPDDQLRRPRRSSARSGPARSSSRACRTSRTRSASPTAGVDGIVLSNHGGRQLDRAPIPFHLLPHVVREVGNGHRGAGRHRHHERRRHRGVDRARREVHAHRPRLPLRPHGRRAAGRRPDDRDPARPRSSAR